MSRREISKQEYALLIQLLSMKEKSLVRSMPRILAKYFDNPRIHSTTDYIYAEGDIPVALVAHLDTVHPAPPQTIYHDSSKGVIWSPDGLGADDRAGLYSIIHILEAGYRPSVIFTTAEEVGGIGARVFVNDFKKPLSPLNFIIELDRQGKNDAVYYDCGNEEFEDFITSFGFATDWGSFSDIAVIGPAWDIATVNLSIGYFDEHTKLETLNYRYMFSTIEKVKKILENPGEKLYDQQEIDYKTWAKGFIDTMGTGDFFYCDVCARPQKGSDLFLVKDWVICGDCKKKHVDQCTICGDDFVNPYHNNKDCVCEECSNGTGRDKAKR